MKICLIAAGVGDTSVCVNCMRDAALIRVLRGLGHEVCVVPLYLPFRPAGHEGGGESEIFFGGINVYLQQRWGVFRKTPRWFDRMFDNERLLEWASKKFRMVNPDVLGGTTVSMLQGSEGFQAKELRRLSGWVGKEGHRPDVVCLSNALLVGLAKSIREACGVPIFCLLNGEDKFLDELAGPYSRQGWETLAGCVGEIEAFIAKDKTYADSMRKRLTISQRKMHFVYSDSSEAERCGPDETANRLACVITGVFKKITEGNYA